MLSGEAANIDFVIFGLTWPWLEPTIYRTQGEHTDNLTVYMSITSTIFCVYSSFNYWYFKGSIFSPSYYAIIRLISLIYINKYHISCAETLLALFTICRSPRGNKNISRNTLTGINILIRSYNCSCTDSWRLFLDLGEFHFGRHLGPWGPRFLACLKSLTHYYQQCWSPTCDGRHIIYIWKMPHHFIKSVCT
jgi:hypothetical protein